MKVDSFTLDSPSHYAIAVLFYAALLLQNYVERNFNSRAATRLEIISSDEGWWKTQKRESGILFHEIPPESRFCLGSVSRDIRDNEPNDWKLPISGIIYDDIYKFISVGTFSIMYELCFCKKKMFKAATTRRKRREM